MANDAERRMLRVIDHIHDNPAGDLSLDALADVAAMSRFHWHRVFHATTGETAAQTVRRMRLHRAAVALVQTDAPQAGIAKAVGYANATSFVRAFADAYGMPPAAFRKRGELRPFPVAQPPKGAIMHPVSIRTEPARHLVTIPHKGAYHEINRAFEKLFASLVARDQVGLTGYMIGVFLDDPAAVPKADLRSLAGVEVPPDFLPMAPLEARTLPGGMQAVLTYAGPYAGLPAAYDQLYGIWLPQSGHLPDNQPSFEVYLNSPMNTSPEKLITELHLPLAG